MPDTVTGKRFVIIGGSSGIGFGVAKLVLEQGAAEVIIASSNQERVDKAVEALEAARKSPDSKVTGKTIDMSQLENIPAFFEGLGDFDHLVSTAGGSIPGEKFPAETDLAAARDRSNDRYWSVLKAIQCSYRQINPGGTITVTSGTTIQRPLPGWSPLSGVAGAIETATRNLALDMAPLRVNCVAPGVVLTELWDGMDQSTRDGMMAERARTLPVGHVGMPDEVAEAYLYLFRCTYVTGQTLFVDGGGLLV